MRKLFRLVALIVFASLSLTSITLAAKAIADHSSKAPAAKAKKATSAKPHRIVIQVDQNDPAVMNLALK